MLDVQREELPRSLRRGIRVIVGLAFAAGALAAAGALGFMGLWTYSGYKSQGDPGLGTLLYLAAISAASIAGMSVGWAFTTKQLSQLRGFGVVFGAVATAFIFWVQSAN